MEAAVPVSHGKKGPSGGGQKMDKKPANRTTHRARRKGEACKQGRCQRLGATAFERRMVQGRSRDVWGSGAGGPAGSGYQGEGSWARASLHAPQCQYSCFADAISGQVRRGGADEST